MKCCIFGAGEYDGRGVGGLGLDKLLKDSFVIAADAGYEYVKKYSIKVDMLLGDFDSLKEKEETKEGSAAGADIAKGALGACPCLEADIFRGEKRIVRHPVEKDDTDTALAVDEGLAAGCDEFFIFGGTGGKRPDHTIANIQLLTMLAKKGLTGYLVGVSGVFTVIEDSGLHFDRACRGGISVFSLSEVAENVEVEGLHYTASGIALTNSRALGVSNEFVGKGADISVEKGTLLVFWSDTSNPLPRLVAKKQIK